MPACPPPSPSDKDAILEWLERMNGDSGLVPDRGHNEGSHLILNQKLGGVWATQSIKINWFQNLRQIFNQSTAIRQLGPCNTKTVVEKEDRSDQLLGTNMHLAFFLPPSLPPSLPGLREEDSESRILVNYGWSWVLSLSELTHAGWN